MAAHRRWALALGTLSAAIYAALSLVRFGQFRITSWDNAIFEQAIARYARLSAPYVEVKAPEKFNILGDHFSPINILIAPFYAVWLSAQTILLAQVILIAVSVAVVAAVAIQTAGRLVGLAIALAYSVSFGLQSAIVADFHEVAFAAPLLALAGAAFVRRRYRSVVIWAIPLVLVKEDLGLTVAAIGATLAIVGWRRPGVWLAIFGAVSTAVTVWLIIPAFATDGQYAYGSSLGGGAGVWTTLVDSPGRKIATVVLTVAITGFAAMLSPWVLVAVPTLAWRFAADNPNYWGTDWHYSLVLMPVVFIAMCDAIKRFEWSRWLAVLSAVVTAGTLINSPLADMVRPSFWQDPPRAATARAVVDAVPRGAVVETDIGLLTHLVTRRTTYWTGSIDAGDPVRPDYVAFDLWSGLGSPDDPLSYAESRYSGRWEILIDRDGYVLVRRTQR